MLPPSHEIRVVIKGISSCAIDPTNVRFGDGHTFIPWLQVTKWRRCSFCFNCQNIQNKVPTYKINLKSITNIAGSNSAGWDCCLFFWLLCAVRYTSLRSFDHMSRRDLQSIHHGWHRGCLSVCLSLFAFPQILKNLNYFPMNFSLDGVVLRYYSGNKIILYQLLILI